MAITLTPEQLKIICPAAPLHAVVALNEILERTRSITLLRAAMVVAQLAAGSDDFRRMEEEPGRRSSTPYFARGWIRLAGLRNYRAAGSALALDLLEQPGLVIPHHVEVTAWFWSAHRLHVFSDIADVHGCTRTIDWTATRPQQLALRRAVHERVMRVLAPSGEVAA